MAAVDAIGVQTRQVLFEVMLSVAWADRELQPEEKQAAEAAALAIGLVLPPDRWLTAPEHRPPLIDQLDFAALAKRDRELVFLCAAWMAVADVVEEPEETHMLGRLRTVLGVSDERSTWLKARARALRDRQLADKTSWWRSFESLVVEAAKALAEADR